MLYMTRSNLLPDMHSTELLYNKPCPDPISRIALMFNLAAEVHRTQKSKIGPFFRGVAKEEKVRRHGHFMPLQKLKILENVLINYIVMELNKLH
jgi:hypothetical protein